MRVKIIRGEAVQGIGCAARLRAGTLVVYLPESEITQAGASSLSDVLTEALSQGLPSRRA
jgi:hypothetical protein